MEEIEGAMQRNSGKSRIWKTRDLCKKTGEMKETLHVRMGMIENRNNGDLGEAEEIKKRWQEYTEVSCRKGLNDPDNHDGLVTHLHPDILECEVKWTLGNITAIKASGNDGIPSELFQILKDYVSFNMSANLENSTGTTGLEKVSFYPNP